ncbi:hypothetical protein OAT67_08135 [Bacteriovoracaceae bacterium]|nr:hypothetical protein [Bacteriovoracaceae bacterium]
MAIYKNYLGFEYITVDTGNKRLSQKSGLGLDKKISEIIIQECPIRGRELTYLRSLLGLSCAKLSLVIKGALSSSTIAKLEQKQDTRLSPVNEVFFRTFFSEALGVKLSVKSKILIPDSKEEPIIMAS